MEHPLDHLVQFALELTPSTIPEECLRAAKRCLIDYFAVTLAGSGESFSEILEKYLVEQQGDSTVIGCHYKTSMEGAAFANGALGHVLDYDDVKGNLGHGTVVIAPAVLALGETIAKSGIEILTAFIAGFEIASRIANSVEPAHSQQGWHTMSTCAIFGATIACGKLLSLDEGSLLGALGIAASFASGLRRNMGTPTKPIHAGQAAQNGLKAALLASQGIYGSRDIFSGPKSFGEIVSSSYQESALTRDLGKDFEICRNGFKLYPSCASSHAAIDAVLELKRNYRFQSEEIEEIRIGTVPIVMDNLAYPEPRDIVQCRFSMSFPVALALVDGKVTLDNFCEDRLKDSAIQRLMKRVRLHLDPEMASLGYRGTENANVTLSMKTKELFHQRVDAAKGHPTNPASDQELWQKFQHCAQRVNSAEKSDRLLESIKSFEGLPTIEKLMTLSQRARP